MKTIQHQPRRGGSGMLVSTRGAILGRYFKTEKQVLKHLNDSANKLKKAGIIIGPEYYDEIAVLQFKNGYLLTTKRVIEKHAKELKHCGTGTHATNKKTVPDDSLDKTQGGAQKRSKTNSRNYKKPSK